MKIAFTSCCDPWNDPIQAAWPELAKQNPDVLVLLGDNMYMDYGLGENEYGLGEPSRLTPAVFASKMHANYARQWAVPNFQRAIQQIPQIFAIWDDHDFAWNNGRGEGTVCSCLPDEKCRCEYVAPIYREISRQLFQQFRDALTTKPAASNYPDYPFFGDLEANFTGFPYTGGIQQTILNVAPNIDLHLLDGRSFRPDANINNSLLGTAQQTALTTAIDIPNKIHILASGTRLEDWRKYIDYAWLKTHHANKKIIVLSGDIHEPKIASHFNDKVFEFTASAMAQPASITGVFGKKSNVFGILDIQNTGMKVNIWQSTKLKESAIVSINDWDMTYEKRGFFSRLFSFLQ